MKKIMILAAAAALALASCAKVETIGNTHEENAVSFGVYAGNSAITKVNNTFGDINLDALKASTDGFGVFAYYTMNTAWASAKTTATPNFMYNQQVKYNGSANVTLYPAKWEYSPLKYWPNGQNSTEYEANATSADMISFFAYAPQIATASLGTVPATNEGIIDLSDNDDVNAPTVTFTVPTAADKQIDLLYSSVTDQTKKALNGKVNFTFHHALAKLNYQVQAVVDAAAPTTTNLTDDHDATLEEGETWIVLESLVVRAAGVKSGTLNLETGNWTMADPAVDSEITYDADAFNFGKDTGSAWSASNTITVTADSKEGFKAEETARDLNSKISPMIIPANIAAGDLEVVANYWVITKDSALDGTYSTIQNVISATNASAINFQKGYKYTIVVRLGLNSVDFDVTAVDNWTDAAGTPVDLPLNS